MWRRGEARACESFRPFRLFAWRASNASSLAFPIPLCDTHTRTYRNIYTPLPDASSSSPIHPCLDQLSAFQEHTAHAATDLGIRRTMDRGKKKRGREEPRERGAAAVAEAEPPKKKGKRSEEAEAVPESCRVDIVDVTDVFRPPGLFEFPWQKGEVLLLPEPPHDWDLGDAFFSSLVDGSSAAIGVPGDRLSPTSPGPFFLPEEPSDGEPDGGVDCIWSSVLRQPLSTVYSKNCNA